jgi:DNA-binding transcriptional ArsR family regulator
MNVNWEALARATAHPLQVSILELLTIDGGRSLSPNEMSQELQRPINNVSYHAGVLREAELIEPAGEQPVRGATEHFYRLAKGIHQ